MSSQTESQPSSLVVIGASAGGLGSLSTILADLPEDFDAPVVIGMHVSPNRMSSLGQILRSRTTLPVVTLQDQVKMVPGSIYVVPSNRNVQIADGHAVLTKDNQGPQPSVDLLFRSAAEAYGENLIAVVLSGTGSDGAIGARFVKMSGGTVIVQDPETAAYPGMPASLASSDVDVSASLDRIGGLLTAFIKGDLLVPTDSEHAMLSSFLDELREETGVDFTTYRQTTLRRRVQRRMAATDHLSLPDYLAMVRRDPKERQQLARSFLINVTRFFRDQELFTYLREHVVPGLIRDAASRNDELRIWSAGCATGEEAYSLAIVLHELLQQAGVDVMARIFATDLDEEAVTFARQGIYPARTLADLPDEVVQRYFTPIGDEFQIKKHIRAMLVFGEHDLARRAPFPRIDLVLCRNVLIYFTLPLQRRALELFAFSLRNGGYLVLGKTETVSPFAENFAPDQASLKVFRRVGARSQMLRSRLPDVLPVSPPGTPGLEGTQRIPRRISATPPSLVGGIAFPRDDDGILYALPCGVVVVNHTYDIQYINTEARRLLGIHTTATDQDLIHLVQRFDPLQIRRTIDQAVQGNDLSRTVVASDDGAQESVQSVEITCRAMETRAGTHIVMTVLDVTERELIRRRLATAEQEATRLLSANEEVLAANYELTHVVLDLREENQHMQSATSEIQAATEEVETLNEELQASNEELETLNEELQATVEELNTTNDDLEARSMEMQGLALSAEGARSQMVGILEAMADGFIVVDEHESIMLQSQLFTTLLGNGSRAPEFYDEDGRSLQGEEAPLYRVSRGESFSMPVRSRSIDREIVAWEATGRPATVDGGPRLGVLTFRRCPYED